MRYASLASGSDGNCHAISDGERTLLVDAGITLGRIKKRLESLGWRADQVQGVAITHEHSDHIKAVPVILRRTDWTILATPDTLRAVEALRGIEVPRSRWIPLEAGRALDWEGWRLHPFAVPHDTVDPVAYRVEAGGARMAVITDLGCATSLVAEYASDLELLVLESNHDVGMLRDGAYPPDVQARILSRVGHLSNESCAGTLDRVLSPALRHVVLAHLSEQSNDPALARLAAADAMGKRGSGARLQVAGQAAPLEVAV
jgi:phosphoribosyl 1,2-cyclic phosphodiesterase